MRVHADPIRYLDEGGWHNVDLRLDGVSCVPLYSTANIKAISPGAQMHVHPGCIEFCLCIKGNLRYMTSDGEYQVLPGHLFVSQPNEPHRRCNNPNGMQLHQILFKIPHKGESVLGLSQKDSSYLVKLLRNFPFRTCPAPSQISTAFMRLHSICRKAKKKSPLRSLKIKSTALELFVALAELAETPHMKKAEINPKVKTVIERINEHPEHSFPLQDMAREAAMSEVMFNNAFKQATGLTPHAYLLDIRIKRARAELLAGHENIAQIASRYRFKTARHFTAVFKRIIGSVPSQIRL